MPPGQPGATFPDYADVVHDGSGGEPPSGRGRGFVPWIVGIGALALIGGGFFAVRAAVSGESGQPAAVIPADAVIYGRIDVDPSAGQQVEALRFANKFPAFRDEVNIPDLNADLREKLFEMIKGDEPELADLDYVTDVKPWLGNRVAFAAMPEALDDMTAGGAGDLDDMDLESAGAAGVMLALQVTDESKAKAGLDKLLAAADGTGGYAITNGYAIIAESTEVAEGFAADAEKTSLADDATFKADMDELGDQGIASMWIDGEAFAKLSDATGSAIAPGVPQAVAPITGSAASAVRFGNRYLEIASVSNVDDVDFSGVTSIGAKLPDTTVFEASFADGKSLIEDGWSRLSEIAEAEDSTFDRQVKEFEKQTGLSIPTDIGTLLGDDFALALDDNDWNALSDPTGLRAGFLTDTNVDAAQDVLDTLLAAIPGSDQLGLQRVEHDGLLAVSLNADYADALGTGSLGTTDGYQLAVPSVSEPFATMYVNVDLLEGLVIDAASGSGASDDELANLRALQAIGASATVSDGVVHSSFRIVVNE